jgi:hypothetical protein
MKPVWWMVGGSVCAWVMVTALVGGRSWQESLFGMIGPLIMASVTWILAERTHTRSPERLTSLLIKAFAAKIVFFGAYVIVMLGMLSLRPVPFVLSFTGYFIALHLMEALLLRRLLAADMRTS